jgi:hypothetical protein
MTGNVTDDTVRMYTIQEKECVQPEKTKWYAPSLPLQALRVFRQSVLRQEQSLRCLFASVSHPRVSPRQHWEVASSAQGGRQGEHAPSVEKAV